MTNTAYFFHGWHAFEQFVFVFGLESGQFNKVSSILYKIAYEAPNQMVKF